MSEFSTESLREILDERYIGGGEAFDRWLAKRDAEVAAKALQRVRELHTRDDGYCRACDRLYPCPTIQALDGAPEPAGLPVEGEKR